MRRAAALLFVLAVSVGAGPCDELSADVPASASGVRKASVQVQTGSDGLTVEQRNIKRRLRADNAPGSIKHLYIVSAFSGQVLLYSTVDGKVTSGSKRLTPRTVHAADPHQAPRWGHEVSIGGTRQLTGEVLGDDGTYGDSGEYLYWFDVQGRYYQYYVTGGVVPLISDHPIATKSIVLNLELVPAGDAR